MKLYPKRGFEWASDGCVLLYCPVLTGNTGLKIYDSNLTTDNDGNATGYANTSEPWVGSNYGTVLNFDGSNDFFSALARQPITTFPFTLEAWATLTLSVGNNIVLIVGTSNTQYFAIGYRDSKFGLFARNPTFNLVLGGPTLAFNTWNHIVGVFNSATSRTAYLNGNLLFNTTTSVFDFLGSNVRVGTGFGSGFGSGFHSGQVASSCIWDRPLTASEIHTLYCLGPGGIWQRNPVRPRSYFAELSTLTNRRRFSRFLGFPG